MVGSGLHDLDTLEQQRIQWEMEHLKSVLDVSGANAEARAKLRTQVMQERANNWWRAFTSINSQPSHEVVQWEEIIESNRKYKVDRGRQLGRGNFSEVYAAKSLETGVDVAVKVIDIRGHSNLFKIKNMQRQIKLLEKLSHPLIVRLLKVYEVKNTQKLLLFMQPSNLGSLELYIKSSGPIPEDKAKKWSRDVITAIGFLHHLGIAHRRIDPHHVLLHSPDAPAKIMFPDALQEIGDYHVKSPNILRCRSAGRKDVYRAPEANFGTSFDPFPVDIWGFGCTVYYMLITRAPFDNWNNRDSMKEQLDSKRWSYCGIIDRFPKLSDGAKTFLTFIIHGATDKRPSAAEILALSWLN